MRVAFHLSLEAVRECSYEPRLLHHLGFAGPYVTSIGGTTGISSRWRRTCPGADSLPIFRVLHTRKMLYPPSSRVSAASMTACKSVFLCHDLFLLSNFVICAALPGYQPRYTAIAAQAIEFFFFFEPISVRLGVQNST